jgi:hypothetical protein
MTTDQEFMEKARTIGVSLRRGSSHKKPVVNEDDGTKAGYHVEHWDDRQDAVATPKTHHMKMTPHQPGEEE